MNLDITLIWGGLLAFVVLAYIVFDGYDLGVGILIPFMRSDENRSQMLNSVRLWDANETWLVLGGGGYTIRNVARCWAYETSVLLDMELPDEIPYNDYYEYYAPDFKLHLTPEQRENMNTEASLESVRVDLLTQLISLKGAPSVQMMEVPPDFEVIKEDLNAEKERKSTKEDRDGEGMNDGGSADDRRSGKGKTKDGKGDRKEHEAELAG